MRRDPHVIVIGEDVSGGVGTQGGRDAAGGVLGVTKGLIGEFGEARVIDTPITEIAAGRGTDVLRLLRRLPVHILPDAGHLPRMEKASAVNTLIRRFIES